jgi:hypothetical protein
MSARDLVSVWVATMKNDGGPAFPVVEQFDERRGEMIMYASQGMSLRDYFAGQALAGVPMPQSSHHDSNEIYLRIALHCYKMADAMLNIREVK